MLGTYGLGVVTVACAAWASLATWSVHDPSFNNATRAAPRNLLGGWGAVVADLAIQSLGLASIILFLPLAAWGWHLLFRTVPKRRRLRLLAWPAAVMLLAATLAALPQPKSWPLPNGLGGILGDFFMAGAHVIGPFLPEAAVSFVAGPRLFRARHHAAAIRLRHQHLTADRAVGAAQQRRQRMGERLARRGHAFRHADGRQAQTHLRAAPIATSRTTTRTRTREAEDWVEEEPQVDADGRIEPSFGAAPFVPASDDEEDEDGVETSMHPATASPAQPPRRRRSTRQFARRPWTTPYEPPSIKLLQQPARSQRGRGVSDEVLQENARELEGVLQDFGVKGEITNVRPGPVVTLYELEPAPGTKSSRVIGLADDIARSMSAISARVAVVPGRNAIGIELPNERREVVLLRELLETPRLPGHRGKAWRSRSARISAASRSSPTCRACRICSSPAPPARASRSASTP